MEDSGDSASMRAALLSAAWLMQLGLSLASPLRLAALPEEEDQALAEVFSFFYLSDLYLCASISQGILILMY